MQDSDMHPAGTCCCCTGDIPLASGPSNTTLVCRELNTGKCRAESTLVGDCRGQVEEIKPLCLPSGAKAGSSVSFASLQGIVPAGERAWVQISHVGLPPLAVDI